MNRGARILRCRPRFLGNFSADRHFNCGPHSRTDFAPRMCKLENQHDGARQQDLFVLSELQFKRGVFFVEFGPPTACF
jgi:hypothetical protein